MLSLIGLVIAVGVLMMFVVGLLVDLLLKLTGRQTFTQWVRSGNQPVGWFMVGVATLIPVGLALHFFG